MTSRAALGVREHSGWAIVVAVAGEVGTGSVIERRRISLLAPGMPTEPYHAAVGVPLDVAPSLLRDSYESARDCARKELVRVIGDLRDRGYDVTALGCGVSAAPVRVPIERLLKSHPLLHGAEGDLFRDAVADAAEALGLAQVRTPWKEVWGQLAAALGSDARETVTQLGAGLGPPWASDEKEACAAAWLALLVHGRGD